MRYDECDWIPAAAGMTRCDWIPHQARHNLTLSLILETDKILQTVSSKNNKTKPMAFEEERMIMEFIVF